MSVTEQGEKKEKPVEMEKKEEEYKLEDQETGEEGQDEILAPIAGEPLKSDQEIEQIEKIQEAEDKKTSFKESINTFLEKHKRIIKPISVSLAVLIVIYLALSIYFIEHFYFGSKINDVLVSGKTIEEVEKIMESELQAHILTLKERGGKIERITAPDVGLKYKTDKGFKKFKQSQKAYIWPMALFNKEKLESEIELSFDKSLLNKTMHQLSCLDDNKVIQPQNPSFKYNGRTFTMAPEVQGNKVDKGTLYRHIVAGIKSGQEEIDLEEIDCYIKPKYNSYSKKVIAAQEKLNTYLASKVIYNLGESKKQLDASTINEWIIVDEDYTVKVEEEKVKEYVNKLAKEHNTVGKTRSIKTPSGKTIKVSGGDYGRSINKAKETKELMEAIKKGKITTRKPVYSQKAFSHGYNDIGNTFVEIDLAKQHIWFYKNGLLIVDGNIVTGNVSRKHTTPKGTYRLKYKAKNVVLRGADYAAPVTFWMPFNGGIGMHDANWRGSFGGNIYKTNGSHGCINCPYNVAKAIYNNIEPNTPVICH